MKYFGTDGIRGRVGQWPMTPDFALKLGWAAGKVLADGGARKVVLLSLIHISEPTRPY